ncbi:MAG: hypothetical protein PVH40_08770, partial [Gemmatimonadales bacterium]
MTDRALARARDAFAEIVTGAELADRQVSVRVIPLTAEQAIGHPRRGDFPIVIGKERVIEARFEGSRGQAFTDSPVEFDGTVEHVLS